MGSKAAALFASLTLLTSIVGCGDEGVAEDATVTVYVEAPLCVAAGQELASQGGRAGEVRIRAICLPSAREGQELNLAALGANARRATEDSTAIAYLEPDDPATARFTHPILESADIGWISTDTGKAAMARVIQAVDGANSSSLRESVREELEKIG